MKLTTTTTQISKAARIRFSVTALLIVAFLFTNISPVASSDARSNDFQYTFKELKDGYVFKGEFFVKGDDSCLLNIVYEPEHLKRVLNHKYVVAFSRRDKDSYVVNYVYKIPFLEIKTSYKKTLCLQEKRVIFEMTRYEQKGISLPRILSSNGYYEIKRENNGFWVKYYQECQLGKSNVKRIYFLFLKNEAVNFLKNLKKYAERTCH